jgi:hypothetical protein
MEAPNPFSEEERIPMLERVFRTIVPTEEDGAMKHDPGQSSGDMEDQIKQVGVQLFLANQAAE